MLQPGFSDVTHHIAPDRLSVQYIVAMSLTFHATAAAKLERLPVQNPTSRLRDRGLGQSRG